MEAGVDRQADVNRDQGDPRMLSDFQCDALSMLCREQPDHYLAKFCRDPQAWYAEAEKIARALKVDSMRPSRILDLGCGFGYFAAACGRMGHTALGLDLDGDVVRRAADLLMVDYRPHQITAFWPIPDELTGYDLIATFGVNFRYEDDTYWDWPPYMFLARDLLKRLNTGGRWVLRPNFGQQHLCEQAQWESAVGDFAHVSIDGTGVTITPRQADEDD
jgi:SAM-dependent methyltransferase